MTSRVGEIATTPEPQAGRTIEGFIAGILLLLASIAAAFMVWTRLQADFDHATFQEMVTAIDQNTLWYSWHGTSRVVFGALLIGFATIITTTITPPHGWQLRGSAWLLSIGGAAMIASGVLVIFISAVYRAEVYDVESLDQYRAVVGSIGNTLVGLSIVLMTPIQWRLGGLMKLSAVLAPIVGVSMVLVWWDSSTIHRLSGAGFFIWMIITAVSLMFGLFGPERTNGNFQMADTARKFQS